MDGRQKSNSNINPIDNSYKYTLTMPFKGHLLTRVTRQNGARCGQVLCHLDCECGTFNKLDDEHHLCTCMCVCVCMDVCKYLRWKIINT